jgi:RNA polymerase primary sigma factor
LGHEGRRNYDSVETLNLLLDKANIQGYITTDDVVEVYPGVRDNGDRMQSIMTALRRRGVDVVEDNDNHNKKHDSEEEDNAPSSDMDIYKIDNSSPSDDTIGLYLKEMAKVPLLKVQEELSIAKRVESGKGARKELESVDAAIEPARQRELELLVQDGQDAREHLIKANTRLVVSIAKRYVGRGVPFLDLIQEGNLGLMKAVEKYEYWRGFRFSTYATWWIRQTITRAIADQGRTIRVPVHMVDRIRHLYRTIHEMEQVLGRAPTSEELAKKLDLTVTKVEWMMRVSWLPLSLESPVNDSDEDAELGMFVEDEMTPSPMQSTYSRLLGEKIEEVLGTLPPREARILRLRFGLDNGHVYTLEEVGRKFGLTRERIRQIESKALRRLRHPRRARQLREYR